MIRIVGSLALLLGTCGIASAAPATQDEADRLKRLFERYVGHPDGQPGVVAVLPHGEAYTTTFDAARLYTLLPQSGVAVTAAPLVAELTPQDDGQWKVTMDGLPLLGVTWADQRFSLAIKGYTFDGLFDPKMLAFASSTSAVGGASFEGGGPKGSAEARMTVTGSSAHTATDAGAGTVDAKTVSTYKDIVVTAGGETPPDAPGGVPSHVGPFTMTIGNGTSSMVATGERVAAIDDLWTFLVAHPSKAALAPIQAELKTKLKAAFPFANVMTVDALLSTIAVTTPLGTFGAAEFSEHTAFDSTTKKGASVQIKLAGLALPDGLAPLWAGPIVPTGFTFGETSDTARLTPAVAMAIDDLDLTADKPLTDDQWKIIVDTASGGDAHMHIDPSSITTPTMLVRFEGDIVSTKPVPTGDVTISVTGLDKAIDAIRTGAPNDPNAAQAISMLSAAKALAKAEGADSYAWHVVAAPGGAITVNGNPIGGPPAAAPAPGSRKKARPPAP